MNATDKKAIPLLATNVYQADIADELGISQPAVSKIANKADVKALVDKAQLQFVQKGTQIAIDSQLDKIKAGKAILANKANPKQKTLKDSEERILNQSYINGVDNGAILQLADKVEQRLLQSVGILPTHMQSNVYLTLIAAGDIHLSNDVIQILQKHLTQDIIDAEVVDQAA